MKRISILILLLLSLIYLAEKTSIAGLNTFQPAISAGTENNEYTLTWSTIRYPAYYEVEVLTAPPEGAEPAAAARRIVSYRTLDNHLTINTSFPFQTYWRVSAHGLFGHPLGKYSDYINLAELTGTTAADFASYKPAATSPDSHGTPASNQPVLTWTAVPGAVYYEIELLHSPPENPNDILPSQYRIYSSRSVFTNGYNADLSSFQGNLLYWRVRALDINDHPLGVYSDAAELWIDHSLQIPLKPLIISTVPSPGFPAPLYPVYSWIPIIGAEQYEVELLSQPPENPNGTAPSIYRIWNKEVSHALDCYDDTPRNQPGTYYWRVLGIDEQGKPVGVFSDAVPLVVDLAKGSYSATFGDSITHGGGAISYSPADWEYSYQSYLDFPTVNLGKSGDTAAGMADRFDNDVRPYKPKFLIILGGTNSLRGGVPASQVIHDLSIIRDKCLGSGIRPIFLTLPPINPEAINRTFNEETVPNWQQEFASVNKFIRQQRYFIDLEPYFKDGNGELPDYYAIDGLHPDIEGKKLMAHIINANWNRVTR